MVLSLARSSLIVRMLDEHICEYDAASGIVVGVYSRRAHADKEPYNYCDASRVQVTRYSSAAGVISAVIKCVYR
jgi:hypothetical protein